MRRLAASYNPAANQQLEAIREQTTVEHGAVAMFEFGFASAVSSDYQEPQSFDEAWNNENETERKNWRDAIRTEFNNMITKGVWRHVKRASLPQDRRLIGSKWVLKKKRSGVYRARLVGLGYSQIPGVDYSESFAPVINDVTYCIMLTIWQMKKWDSAVVDVETAFLYRELEESIYMKCPQGLDEYFTEQGKTLAGDEALVLVKAIYGLVQAAR